MGTRKQSYVVEISILDIRAIERKFRKQRKEGKISSKVIFVCVENLQKP